MNLVSTVSDLNLDFTYAQYQLAKGQIRVFDLNAIWR